MEFWEVKAVHVVVTYEDGKHVCCVTFQSKEKRSYVTSIVVDLDSIERLLKPADRKKDASGLSFVTLLSHFEISFLGTEIEHNSSNFSPYLVFVCRNDIVRIPCALATAIELCLAYEMPISIASSAFIDSSSLKK